MENPENTENVLSEQLTVEQLQAVVEEKTFALTEAESVIEELKGQLIAEQSRPQAVPTITVGEDTYQVLAKSFQFEGQTHTVEELLSNTGMQAVLVGKGAGFLEKL